MNFVEAWQQMSAGMIETCKIFFLTLLFTLPLGMVIAFGRMSKIKPIRWITTVYISIMRGTPLMLQLLVVYFGPSLIFEGYSLDRFQAVIIGFVLNYAAYFAEIYRAGIESMPRGQYEAAKVLGYNKEQTFVKIILPQVMKRVLPPITNEVITLVKDTSLAFSISHLEMFNMAKQLSATHSSLMPLLVAGVFFYVFNLLVALVMNGIEKKMNYYR